MSITHLIAKLWYTTILITYKPIKFCGFQKELLISDDIELLFKNLTNCETQVSFGSQYG